MRIKSDLKSGVVVDPGLKTGRL